MRTTVLLALLVLLAIGCGPATEERTEPAGDSPISTAATPGLVRGLVVLRSDTPVVLPCGSQDTIPLITPRGTQEELQARARKGPVFAILAGSTGSQVVAERLLYASADRFDCFADWSAFSWRATGQQPGWVAEVRNADVQLRLEGDRTFTWTDVTMDSTSEGIRITAPAAGGFPLDLTLHLRPCQNPVSQSYSAWTATLSLGAERLHGCAVPGVR